MKSTQRKDAWRNISKQAVSFASIIIIALLGVTAYLGICYAAEAMRINGSRAYNERAYRDLEIMSTKLLTSDDLAALRSTEGVKDVEPLWQTGANIYIEDIQYGVTAITVTERLNQPALRAGRLPETATECAIEKRLADTTGLDVGDQIEWLEMTEATGQYFLGGDPFTITGIVEHPDHTNLNVPDVPYVLVTSDLFDHEALDGCCMKALVAVDNPADDYRFSTAYKDSVALVSARIEELAPVRTVLRDQQIKAQALEQIDALDVSLAEAKQTLEDSRAQLDDGWAQLKAAEQQLAEGDEELAAARAQLDEVKQQLDDGKAALLEGGLALSSARRRLTKGWNQLEEAKENVRDALRDALDTSSGLDSSQWIGWADPQPANVSNSHVTAQEFWITNDVMLDTSLPLEEMAAEAIHSAQIPDSVLQNAYDLLYADDPNPPPFDPDTMRADLAAQASEQLDAVASDYEKLSDGCAQWDKGHKQYLSGASTYSKSQAQYEEAVALYEAGEAEYAEALAIYESGLAQLKELDEKRQELEEGERQYAEGIERYEYALSYREQALSEINGMEPSRWIVLDSTGNASFVQLNTSSQNLSSLQVTFSLLFVVIGAMVIYATISKMVDEQRTLIGATKALGFYNREILAKYLLFGLLATIFGAILGILLARFWIEGFILKSYNTYFTIDLRHPLVILKPTFIVILSAAILATAAATFACLRLVRMPAIQLMQAPVPKGQKKAVGSGKRLLSLYSRLVLLNIRTDMKRVLVTVVSVAGCCTLIVVGFTLKYAIDRCMRNQYTQVVAYDGRIRYDYGGDLEEAMTRAGVEYVPLYDGNVTFRIRDMDMGELFCGDIAAIEDMYRLNDITTGQPLAPTDEGIFIQRRLAEIYDLTVGSEFEMILNNTNTVTVRVAGVFENYIGRTMVMSSAYYASLCGEAPAYNAFFVRFGDVDQEVLLAELNETLGFRGYAPSDEGKAMFEASTSVINAVVALFIFMAAVMAGVVLMNLTDIYILQKKRELTIMRINGFTTREVIAYVTRETVLTTIAGILLGFAAGSVIGYRIVRALEQSFVRLERGICFPGWVFAAAMTVLFTVIVNAIALRKVKDLKLTDVA